jgi:hypothetical protein
MRRPPLPSPAFSLALLSLFVSLGGTTYAIATLPRDSVGTKQIRARAVTESELSNNAVISRKLANGAVTERKIARNAITGSRIAPDSIGGAQIDEASLLAVPFAQQAETAKLAARAQVADRVERVGRADAAGTADRAALADRAIESEHAEQADQADEAAVAAVAEALDDVDIVYEEVTLAEGGAAVFEASCDAAAGYVAINGGFRQIDDFGDLTTIVGSGRNEPDEAGWFVIVADPRLDDPPFDDPTNGLVWVVCVKEDIE